MKERSKDEKAKVDRDNLTNRLLHNGDSQTLNELDKALEIGLTFSSLKLILAKKE
ncbi:TPA: hypothetical protein RTH42_001183 [Campylobacter jejuni]|nr:hypothetical protein [Campylobacter jejuni]HDZ4994687.1 hypothetical protein [Campylobacter jejuni]HDZ5008084.1 hypothetical protein [Campylobacter jejuni]HDZ5011313.1 hypothetical protein [Campylobacter jejuni]HDZ5013604.1 hypothetical protein [Campylobacter jejuni]